MSHVDPDLRAQWDLDPTVTFLNHGSFGACPRVVQEARAEYLARLEREPVDYFVRHLDRELTEARVALADFVGADAEDLAFVPNATTGVSTVLRSLELGPDDDLLVTDHAYRACRNALDFVASRSGARVMVASLPFPCGGPEELVAPILDAVTPRTRLALIDQITSPTGLVLPVCRLVSALAERGVDVLVDAAHGPGMVALDLDATGAAYTTGNCHKWLCTPKVSGFLHVRRDLQARIRPLAISHGASLAASSERSRFRLEFDWPGTFDPTPYLCVPVAIQALGELVPGGWTAIRARNRALAIAARRLLCERLRVSLPCPEELLGSLAAIPLPRGADVGSAPDPDPLHLRLWQRHRIEVPVFPGPARHQRVLRISAQLYNSLGDYQALAEALAAEGEVP